MVWIGWLIVALLLGLVLIFTVELAFAMFAGGAIVAAVVAAFTDNLAYQIIAFCAVSVVLLFTVRPWAKRYMERSSPETRTNADALIAKTAEALSDVTDRGGRIKLDGEVWSARTHGTIIPQGALCSVVQIQGATAIVYPLENHG